MTPALRRTPAAIGAALLLALPASAQELPRVRVDLDAFVTGIASRPQRDEFGVGVGAALRVRLRAFGPLGVHLVAAASGFPPTTAQPAWGTLLAAGLGTHVAPRVGPGVLVVDAEAQLFPTAGAGPGLAFGAGIGYLLRATPAVDLGPAVRGTFGQAVFGGAGGRRDDMHAWSAGISASIHAPSVLRVARDSDGDGLDDRLDRCPAEAEDLDGFRDGDGCPELDDDGDGVRDLYDRCPNTPEDRDGFDDLDGCPDDDDDGDGVRDRDDRCPWEPEDPDGNHDDDGCPDDDDDGDGVRDGDDRCLTQRETRNGFLDDDGCPDDAPPRATLQPGRVTLSHPITFEDRSDRIRVTSRAALDAVARLLREPPAISALRVEASADELPTARANVALATRRARAVLRYISSQGVNPVRMIPVGVRGTRRGDGTRADFVIVAGPWAGTLPARP